jgi:hypothetical protein
LTDSDTLRFLAGNYEHKNTPLQRTAQIRAMETKPYRQPALATDSTFSTEPYSKYSTDPAAKCFARIRNTRSDGSANPVNAADTSDFEPFTRANAFLIAKSASLLSDANRTGRTPSCIDATD